MEGKDDWEWCWGREQMSAVYEDKVYLIGGFIAETSASSKSSTKSAEIIFGNPDIFVYDFSKSIPAPGIPKLTKIPLPLEQVPILKWGAFWPLGDSSDTLLLHQGELQYYPPVSSTNHTFRPPIERTQPDGKVYEYTISKDVWKTTTPKDDSGKTLNTVARVSAAVSKKSGKGFAMGGRMSRGNYLDSNLRSKTSNPGMQPSFLSSMLVLDTESGGWKNETTALEPNESGTLSVIENVGEEGLLVLLGGDTGDEAAWRSLRTVQVYDIATQEWYNQETTAERGFYPPNRIHHCTVVSPAPDGSSHNIYMYGGWTGPTTTADTPSATLSDLWVLSLPSFHWIPLVTTSGDNLPRMDHACEPVGPNSRYMFVFGGDKGTGQSQACDANATPARLLDLSTAEWNTRFDPDSKYAVPNKIYDVIGGTQDGGATMKEPQKGFADPSLKALFQTTTPPSPSSSSKSGGSTPPNTTLEKTSKSLSTGAIIGIVLGILALLSLLSLLFFLRLRKKRNARYQGPVSSSYSGPTELDGTRDPTRKRWDGEVFAPMGQGKARVEQQPVQELPGHEVQEMPTAWGGHRVELPGGGRT